MCDPAAPAGEEYGADTIQPASSADAGTTSSSPSNSSTTSPTTGPAPIAAAPTTTKPFKGSQIVASNTLQEIESRAGGRNSTATSGTTAAANQTATSATARPQGTVKAVGSGAGGVAGMMPVQLLVLGVVMVVGMML